MGRSAAGPPGRWYLGPNLLPGEPCASPIPYPGALPCDPGLSLLVLDRGAVLGGSGSWTLRRFAGALFPVDMEGRVWQPLPSPLPFLRVWADDVLHTGCGRIYRWAELCASEDDSGRESALHCSFDDWVWEETTRVGSGDLAGDLGRRARYHLHRWSEAFFVSVDPRPAPFRSFDSWNGALLHALHLARHPG